MQNNHSVAPEGHCDPRKSRVDSGEVDVAIGAFPGSLTPLPAPRQDALHPHAVILSADEPADPQEILRAFERSLTGDLPNSARNSQDPRGQTEDPESIALVVGTSGSTGAPKQTALSVRAMRASARATERFLRTTLRSVRRSSGGQFLRTLRNGFLPCPLTMWRGLRFSPGRCSPERRR